MVVVWLPTDHIPNFSPIGYLAGSLQSNQLPVNVAETKPRTLPHPHVVNNSYLVTLKSHAKFLARFVYD